MKLEQYIELRNAYRKALAIAIDKQYMGTLREQRAAWRAVEVCAENVQAQLSMTPAELDITINALAGKEI